MRLGLLVAAVALGAAPAARADSFHAFRMPSGNVGCMLVEISGEQPSLRCDVLSGLRPMPPKPRSCQLDWGVSVSMGDRGRASVGCVGDTVMVPGARVLAYGTRWRHGGIACVSRASGLTCTNRSGHGWVLSRERSRLF